MLSSAIELIRCLSQSILGGECAYDRPIQRTKSGRWSPVRDHNASHFRVSGIKQGGLGECHLFKGSVGDYWIVL